MGITPNQKEKKSPFIPFEMKVKIILTLFLFAGFSTIAQRKITPTDAFVIEGKIKQSKSISLANLSGYEKLPIGDQIIYNHKSEIKDRLKNCKGILLKNLLAESDFVFEKPKELNEFYIVCIASDGYKVVFSWNEIYNSDIGNHLFILTESDGKPATDSDSRIQLISTADSKNGRRYVKALERIAVKRTE
jgi:hypothetical protein